MSRFLSLIIVLFPSFALAAAPVPAGKPGAIPTEIPVLAKSMLVFHLNGYDQVKEKIKTITKSAFPKDGESLAKKIDEGITSAFEGIEIKGVTKDGRVYLAVHEFEMAEDYFPIALVVPVSDGRAFLNGVVPKAKFEKMQAGYEKIETAEGETFYAVVGPTQVVLVRQKELAEQYVGKFDALKTKLMGDAAEAYFKSDVSLFVNMDAINEVHGEQIKQFRGFFNLMIDQVAGAGGPGMDKRQVEMIKTVYAGLFQMMDDGRSVVFGGEIRPDGVALKLIGRFKPDSDSGKIIAAEKPIKLSTINDLPKGYMTYTASSYGPKVAKLFTLLYREFVAADSDDSGAEKLDEWSKLLAKGTSIVSASEIGKSVVTLTQHPEAKKTADSLAAALKAFKEGASFQNIRLKGKPEVVEASDKHRDISFHKITIKVDFAETVKAMPEIVREAAIASMKKLLPETTAMWIGSTDKQIVQVTAPDWAAAKKAIDAAFDGKSTIGQDTSVQATLTALPAEASFVGLYDIGSGLNFLADYLPAIAAGFPGAEVGGEMPKFKHTKGDPVFAGVSLVLKGDSVTIDFFVPTKAAGIVREAISPLMESKD